MILVLRGLVRFFAQVSIVLLKIFQLDLGFLGIDFAILWQKATDNE